MFNVDSVYCILEGPFVLSMARNDVTQFHCQVQELFICRCGSFLALYMFGVCVCACVRVSMCVRE